MNSHATLLAAGTVINASGNMAQDVVLDTATMASIFLDLSVRTGTPTIDFWLEGYDSTNAKYFPVPYDQQVTMGTPGTDISAAVNKVNINGPASAAAVGQHHARYNFLPAGRYRLRWVLGGSTSYTVGAGMELK